MREGKHNSIEGQQKMHPIIHKFEFNPKFVKVPLVDVDRLKGSNPIIQKYKKH